MHAARDPILAALRLQGLKLTPRRLAIVDAHEYAILDVLREAVTARSDFVVSTHRLDVYGLCAGCAGRAGAASVPA